MESDSCDDDDVLRIFKSIRSAMVDFNVLDCPICFETLTIPIFQCNNGHLACSSCCPKLRNKCPLCASPIGHNRCRAMESVLESVFVPCPNAKLGCTKNLTYGKESIHEKECAFSQCSCPVLNCNYTGSYKELYNHYSTHLKSNGRRVDSMFSCGIDFSAHMDIKDKVLVHIENIYELLFAMQCVRKPYGVYVTVSCIAPCAPEVGEFSYHLSYTSANEYTMTYESPEMKMIREVSFQTPQENSMLIPRSFLSGDLLKLKLRINKLA